ncbi:hypothetical protein SAMN05518854_12216 [Variovorax sp. YR266]|uniref:hypothetical protein n=1 Tax=Variovorax sp. YR266 TaxID=1884386 RepID=UPI000895F9E8|nr:hypothetical protein [Variovorax sp. YR266]SDZ72082.1 hypothetical protein SAMN05518854_12216 [Variovorax sp. YR266]
MKHFKYIAPSGELVRLSPRFTNPSIGSSERAIICEVEGLAHAASLFFCGTYPVEAPYFFWGAGRVLPWNVEFLRRDPKGGMRGRAPSEKELDLVLGALQKMGCGERPTVLSTYHNGFLCSSEKLKFQGLAVEVMMALDEFLAGIQSGPPTIDLMLLLCEAYKCLSELTVQAESLLVKQGTHEEARSGRPD